ncbi:AMP-binding protein [Arthrobacter sp. zg-Y1171]|uniref:AMP-binding protein n=1 Tax=Arthrobacter sp. zg-Y1171 TaxID=2964610 RepID=UPI002107C358|nr:AMP-binding protein [Arthrobacter sp. zg-Y1171]MCQ1994374.1 AMP-binding protein [Arthrobacter sp. zg-Y1171]UWX81535.1 AMP-binding protein [Arthrobacter sp. zg-Y1171]
MFNPLTVQEPVAPAALLCDRHPADSVAFTVIEQDLSATDLTYGELQAGSERAAAAFARRGVRRGDRVATLMGKSGDLVTVLLGLWRLGAVHVPLFTAFATPAISVRLAASGARLVVADENQLAKVAPLVPELGLTVLAAGTGAGADAGGLDTAGAADALDWTQLLSAEQPGMPAAVLDPQEVLVEIFTSGTTGAPKGVTVPVSALEAFSAYFHYGLDVQEGDVFWNAADPGWAYGLYYGILAPLAAGRRNLLLRGSFSAKLCWEVLDRFRVTNFAAAPTIFRSLRAEAPDGVGPLALQRASSAGEPLDAETISWATRCLGTAVRDHYGQTEMGMCIVNGWEDSVSREIRPGSMGHALPGYRTEVLSLEEDSPAASGEKGRVAIDVPASPLMWFSGYTDNPEKTAERYSSDGRWYYTGDTGSRDADGYTYFSARDDDVIIMAGYRIGPFEVESVLATHPEVAESAVIGVPDELRGERLEAYVVLRSGSGSPELAAELQQLVKTQYAAHAYPRAVHFVEELPKTPSGKLQRFLLRASRSASDSEPPVNA